ncbi:MAG TPA: MoaD/ThiS family protein [Nocardioides sp.]|uniref:MoaD/ThiS family protein n=1 Tax=Nocardioides sp. TaxID=35761 RepID=UPI002C107017|nr:MoaD/ThiS family protein [Nocardioides sp.]HTW17569.1 MoaD/ThiS family protein [Nocardioides sp.]
MTDTSGEVQADETDLIRVRYWAAAKAAAGVAQDELPVTGPLTLAEVLDRVLTLHPDAGLAKVVSVCSVLVDDRPVGSADPATLQVAPGSSVELLPPFAGG